MMRAGLNVQIHELLASARTRAGARSNRELAARLGLNHAAVSNFAMGRNWPSDATMVRLSLLAGVPAAEGLLLLNMWRSPADVAAIYAGIHRRLCKTAAGAGK